MYADTRIFLQYPEIAFLTGRSSLSGKNTAIRRTAVRETFVSLHRVGVQLRAP